uniref:Uncharacterized protein n=1 Tax=Micrurus corallinus TaxID=54390 RepID=A0A2D4G5K9_MICCO
MYTYKQTQHSFETPQQTSTMLQNQEITPTLRDVLLLVNLQMVQLLNKNSNTSIQRTILSGSDGQKSRFKICMKGWESFTGCHQPYKRANTVCAMCAIHIQCVQYVLAWIKHGCELYLCCMTRK